MAKRVLICGETWMTSSTHVKGFDSFSACTMDGGVRFLREALQAGGYEVTHMPAHIAAEEFPYTLEELSRYDCVIFSDIGANTFLLPAAVFVRGERRPNRLNLVEEYVRAGGAFMMVGGYLTFTGFQAKGFYAGTAAERVLSVRLSRYDDRVELPQGGIPVGVKADHPVLAGVGGDWPYLLGYNRAELREDAELVASIEGDPFIAVREVGRGRTAVFTSDCAPHWCSPDFVAWEHYGTIWRNLVGWLTRA